MHTHTLTHINVCLSAGEGCTSVAIVGRTDLVKMDRCEARSHKNDLPSAFLFLSFSHANIDRNLHGNAGNRWRCSTLPVHWLALCFFPAYFGPKHSRRTSVSAIPTVDCEKVHSLWHSWASDFKGNNICCSKLSGPIAVDSLCFLKIAQTGDLTSPLRLGETLPLQFQNLVALHQPRCVTSDLTVAAELLLLTHFQPIQLFLFQSVMRTQDITGAHLPWSHNPQDLPVKSWKSAHFIHLFKTVLMLILKILSSGFFPHLPNKNKQ